jgi:hypothetical protein
VFGNLDEGFLARNIQLANASIKELDLISARYIELLNVLKERKSMKFFYLVLLCLPIYTNAFSFHRAEELDTTTIPYAGRSSGEPCEDINLVRRIMNAYKIAQKHHLGNSMWQMFYDQKLTSIHNAFQSENLRLATDILRNPHKTDLFYGFDNLAYSVLSSQFTYESLTETAGCCLDGFLRFGESIGAIRLDNPESYGALRKQWTANEVLQTIESYLKISVHFPNPYTDEVGVCTSHGIASYRAIQALYQAWRIKELVKDIPHPRVLEIGAGLGRTAYYCKLFGITDYTIIDIPMTALASSYFLGRTLGEDQIVLLGESLEGSENKVKIFTPDQLLNDVSQYDLIVNIDSLTEIDPNTIKAYLEKIQQISSMFLSINHEINRHTVFELLSSSLYLKKMHRYPYWMRFGYVEELYLFDEE